MAPEKCPRGACCPPPPSSISKELPPRNKVSLLEIYFLFKAQYKMNYQILQLDVANAGVIGQFRA